MSFFDTEDLAVFSPHNLLAHEKAPGTTEFRTPSAEDVIQSVEAGKFFRPITPLFLGGKIPTATTVYQACVGAILLDLHSWFGDLLPNGKLPCPNCKRHTLQSQGRYPNVRRLYDLSEVYHCVSWKYECPGCPHGEIPCDPF